jgi:hypothetical protein
MHHGHPSTFTGSIDQNKKSRTISKFRQRRESRQSHVPTAYKTLTSFPQESSNGDEEFVS